MANKHQVIALARQGKTSREIADALKCGAAYVRAVARRERLALVRCPIGGSKPFTPEQWAASLLKRITTEQYNALRAAFGIVEPA